MPGTETTGVTAAISTGTGGLSGDTELLGDEGFKRLDSIEQGDVVYAMAPGSRASKLKPVRDVGRFEPRDALTIDTRRADLRIAPTQRIPFVTDAIDRVRFQRASTLGERHRYRFVTDWEPLLGNRRETIDVTRLTDRFEVAVEFDGHGHTFQSALPEACSPCQYRGTGRYAFDAETFRAHRDTIEALASSIGVRAATNHRPQPYLFDADDFIQLVGWVAAEGSVYDKPDRNTASLKIAQEESRYRGTIRKLLDRMGFRYRRTERDFRIGSKFYGRLFQGLCGHDSRSKRLPDFVWGCSHAQKRLLLETLLAGDGNSDRTYYTVSDELAGDVLRLCAETGITPRYNRRHDWRIYCRHVPHGFLEPNHCETIQPSQPYYRLTVEDYPTVLAGRNGTFQWVAAGGVA